MFGLNNRHKFSSKARVRVRLRPIRENNFTGEERFFLTCALF